MNVKHSFCQRYLPLFLLLPVFASQAAAAPASAPGPFAILDPLWDVEKIIIIYVAGGGGVILGGGLADGTEIVFGLPLGEPVDPWLDNITDNLPKVHEEAKPYLYRTGNRVIRVAKAVESVLDELMYLTEDLSDWLMSLWGVPVYAAGDANTDGVVDFADFLIVSDNFGMQTDPSASPTVAWEAGDFDQDGIVGFSDFLLLEQHY